MTHDREGNINTGRRGRGEAGRGGQGSKEHGRGKQGRREERRIELDGFSGKQPGAKTRSLPKHRIRKGTNRSANTSHDQGGKEQIDSELREACPEPSAGDRGGKGSGILSKHRKGNPQR